MFHIDHLLCHHEDDTKALLIILKVRKAYFSLAGDQTLQTVFLGVKCEFSNIMRQVVKKTDSCVGQLANVILLISIFFSPGHYCIWWLFCYYDSTFWHGICTLDWVFSSESCNSKSNNFRGHLANNASCQCVKPPFIPRNENVNSDHGLQNYPVPTFFQQTGLCDRMSRNELHSGNSNILNVLVILFSLFSWHFFALDTFGFFFIGR